MFGLKMTASTLVEETQDPLETENERQDAEDNRDIRSNHTRQSICEVRNSSSRKY